MIFTRHPSRILLLALASVGMNAALAQSHNNHDGHGASASPAAITTMDAMDGDTSGSPAPMNHGAMNHGSMKMDSGSAAPADARDPHGYSNGYTLDTGPYARKDISALMMSDMHSFGSFLRVGRDSGNFCKNDSKFMI